MKIKNMSELSCDNKSVLLRVDFNVPLDGNGHITDDTRIVEAIPTIMELQGQGAKIIIVSHLGRPDGVRDAKYSLEPVAIHLSRLLGQDILLVNDFLSDNTKPLIESMEPGDIIMLENIRFYPEEEAADETFGKALASLADVFVNDAFGTLHRKHASTYTVAKFLPSCVGLLVERELEAFEKILNNPEPPFVAILGGAKVSDKLPLIEFLLNKVNTILIGGGMAYTFIKAIGGNVGDSLVSDKHLDLANKILEKAKEKNVNIVLPVDNIAADKFNANACTKNVTSAFIPTGFQGMDIGPKTIRVFKKYIKTAKTIVWNGPVGVYEFSRFSRGTKKIAKAIAKSKAYSIIGGGDSAASIKNIKLKNNSVHISTGGGVSLLLLEGKKLPCLEVMEKKK